MNCLHVVIAVLLNASQRYQIGVGMNRSARCGEVYGGLLDWIQRYIRTCTFIQGSKITLVR